MCIYIYIHTIYTYVYMHIPSMTNNTMYVKHYI